jgi:hypothetical protein
MDRSFGKCYAFVAVAGMLFVVIADVRCCKIKVLRSRKSRVKESLELTDNRRAIGTVEPVPQIGSTNIRFDDCRLKFPYATFTRVNADEN